MPETIAATLIARSERQAQLFNRGDMVPWFELFDPSDDFTIMDPFGGPVSHGFAGTPERLASLASRFRNGDAALEVAESYVTDDMVVLAYIERQTTEVSGLPSQDWSLRVTQVFRRDGDRWQLVHRHADPLVHGISLDQSAALARGV